MIVNKGEKAKLSYCMRDEKVNGFLGAEDELLFSLRILLVQIRWCQQVKFSGNLDICVKMTPCKYL